MSRVTTVAARSKRSRFTLQRLFCAMTFWAVALGIACGPTFLFMFVLTELLLLLLFTAGCMVVHDTFQDEVRTQGDVVLGASLAASSLAVAVYLAVSAGGGTLVR